MLQLQRAVFLRGVSDPSEESRITTTFYRPKHRDLYYHEGFVRSGSVLVPVDNVVEMLSLPVALPEAAQVTEEPAVEEAVIRRRGRPRKFPVS